MVFLCAGLNTGRKLPLIGLGTYKLSGEAMRVAVDAALSSYYRVFDTAKVYGNEGDLGTALKELIPKYGLLPEEVKIITKIYIKEENCADAVRADVLDSLEKLQTSCIDVVLIHYPRASTVEDDDKENPRRRKETYLALEQLKEEGLIKSVGVSNYEQRHIEEIKAYGKMMPCINQIELHPHFTRDSLRQYCRKERIVLMAYSSLARHTPLLLESEAVKKIATEKNCQPQHVLLLWAYCQYIGIIPKSENPERIRENIQATQISLTKEEINSLSALNIDQNYVRCTGWLVA